LAKKLKGDGNFYCKDGPLKKLEDKCLLAEINETIEKGY